MRTKNVVDFSSFKYAITAKRSAFVIGKRLDMSSVGDSRIDVSLIKLLIGAILCFFSKDIFFELTAE